jgi:hypothetical protein
MFTPANMARVDLYSKGHLFEGFGWFYLMFFIIINLSFSWSNENNLPLLPWRATLAAIGQTTVDTYES